MAGSPSPAFRRTMPIQAWAFAFPDAQRTVLLLRVRCVLQEQE